MRDKIFEMLSIDSAEEAISNGTTLVDLMSTSVKLDSDTEFSITKIGAGFDGKPHFISRATTGTHNYIDVLCSVNGYSNPLTMKAGDIIMVPDGNVISSLVKRTYAKMEGLLKNKKREASSTTARLDFLKAKQERKDAPNVSETGRQFIKARGVVILGAGAPLEDDAVLKTTEKLINNIK